MSKMVVNKKTGLEHGAEQWHGPVKTKHGGVHTKSYMIPVDGSAQCWSFYVQDASGNKFFLTEGDWILTDRSSWATSEEKGLFFAISDVAFSVYYRDRTDMDCFVDKVEEYTKKIGVRLGKPESLDQIDKSQIKSDLGMILDTAQKMRKVYNDK